MNRTTTIKHLLFSISVLCLVGCTSSRLPVVIEKGKIQDDVTINFTQQKISIKPDEFFTLSELGLRAGETAWQWSKEQTIDQYKSFDNPRSGLGKIYPVYNITIKKPGYSNPYYGKILFLNASEASNTEAVARYYEIQIPNQYFENAKGGRIACVYEFSNRASTTSLKAPGRRIVKIAGAGFSPTWIIWLSDTPM
jgi:hypothetical protein